MMTSSTSFASTLARAMAALSATAPKAWAVTLGKRAVEGPDRGARGRDDDDGILRTSHEMGLQ